MTEPGFTEEWFPPGSCDVLADLVAEVVDVPGDLLEIGSWEGRSTVALANAAHPRIVHAVDTWKGSPSEPSERLAAGRDVHAQWLTNMEHMTAGNVEGHRTGWRDYTNPGPFALVFIDAEHTYREVFEHDRGVLAAHVTGRDHVRRRPPPPAGPSGHLRRVPVTNPNRMLCLDLADMTLAAEYERLKSVPSDIYQHLPTFVELVHTLDAKHVIELGTRTGVSTIAWLHALEKTGGRLTSVDIDEQPAIGDHPHWEFVRGDDCDPDIVSRLDPADIVFIDTSHHYAHTLAELHLYRWLVKPGGRMVLHDTMLIRPEGAPARPVYPVTAAIEDFTEATGYAWTNHPHCFGLGIIEGFD